MLAIDLAEHVLEVGVPVYFLHGVHDYTCTYAEASTYFDSLTAPLKGFYTFSESAHSPMFEEPDRVMLSSGTTTRRGRPLRGPSSPDGLGVCSYRSSGPEAR